MSLCYCLYLSTLKTVDSIAAGFDIYQKRVTVSLKVKKKIKNRNYIFGTFLNIFFVTTFFGWSFIYI